MAEVDVITSSKGGRDSAGLCIKPWAQNFFARLRLEKKFQYDQVTEPFLSVLQT